MSIAQSLFDPLEASSVDLAASRWESHPDSEPQALLKVLHVINGEHFAGAERVQDLLALSLPDFGVEVSFACVKPDRFPDARRSQSTPLTNLQMGSRFDLRPAWRLAKMVRSGRFDLIHTHTPRSALVGAAAARLAGVPLVHHVHGQTVTEVGRGWRARIAAQAERFSLSGAAAVIAVSPSAARYIQNWGVPAERVHFVSNGVPGRIDLAERDTPKGIWTIGIIALFRPRKGLEVLLEAITQLQGRRAPVRLRAIGGFETTEYEQQVRRLAESLGISELVEWRGFRGNIDAELNALDLAILPSVLAEGLPMVVIEAMAAGVPPIGSRVDGISDVIQHGHNGLLVEPGDPVALADAISAVIENKHDWQLLRRNAVATHAAQYSDRAMAHGVANVYRKVLTR